MAIVEDVVMRMIPEEERFLAPKMDLLKRSTNLHRSKVRPTEPRDINFEMDLGFISSDEFLVKDIQGEGFRHIVFATRYQLELLAETKVWYMDGTFKIVPDFLKPRGQLLSLHGFVRRDGKEQQFPLAFALMSSRQESDYVKVFNAILEALPARPAVEMFMVDFELGAWNAISAVFPDAVTKGCTFHWCQAVWRHIQELGLAATFMKREATHRYLKQLMALPFLPSPDIPAAFQTLKERANTEPLQSLVGYIDRQWMNHSVFHPSAWTVYRQAVRTNNDVEGWHHRVNGKAGHRGCTFYKLVPLLLHEAKLVETRVSSENLFRDVRQSSSATQKKLTEAWEQYDAGQLSTGHFLRLCGTVYAPCE